MRTSHRIDDRAPHEIRIIRTQQNLSGSLVDVVAGIDVSEKGRAEETGDVGVVHDVPRAVAVDFVGVDVAGLRVVDDAGGGDSGAERGGEGGHARGQIGLPDSGGDGGGGGEVDGEHHVAWDEELICGV